MTYTPQFDFAGYQATSPAKPLPGSWVDAELAAIQAFLDTLSAYIDDVRRADSNLQNGIVTWDALTDEVKEAIRPTGNLVSVENIFDSLSINGILVPDINPEAFATQVEAAAGVANDRLMTPLRTAQALSALRAFATQAQAEAGTNATTVLSPLRGSEMLDTLRAFATQAQAEAGTDAATVLSPLRGADQVRALRRAVTGSGTLTWGAIGAAASATQAVAVSGAVVGDRVTVGLPASGIDAGILPTAWVSSAGTITVRLTNITASPITPYAGAATYMGLTAIGF